jgi:hypothetical protein
MEGLRKTKTNLRISDKSAEILTERHPYTNLLIKRVDEEE